MNYIAGLKCVSCGRELSHEEAKYTCPSCGGNLDVVYDYSRLKKKITRAGLKKNTDLSMWRYSFLLPLVEPKKTRIPSLTVGWTPLSKASALGDKLGLQNLYFKDDTKTPSASFKDRASALVAVKGQELGAKTYTTASTGNAGCALACMCANLRLPCTIFVPETAPKAKIAQLLIFGSRVIAVRGTYDEAFDLSVRAAEEFGWYCRSTGYNPYTREGKKTAAFEIAEQLKWKAPDKVFVPVGDGNIISGIWKGFSDLYDIGLIDKLPQVIGVQSNKSNAISLAVKKYEKEKYSVRKKTGPGRKKIEIEPVHATTIADSISVDLPRDGVAAVMAVVNSGGFMIEVSDEEILSAIKEIACIEGIFSEPAGAASYAGLKKLLGISKLKTRDTIVCLITGNGLKDINSAMKVAGEPLVIEPSLQELKKVIS